MNLLYTLALTYVYIFNSQGQYLSVGEDGKPVLSNKPVAMDVTDANETPAKTPIARTLTAQTSSGY